MEPQVPEVHRRAGRGGGLSQSARGWLGRFVISAALLAGLLIVVDFADVARAFSVASWPPLAGAAALFVVAGTFARGARWRALLAAQGLTVGFGTAFRLFALGAASGQVLPTGIGGDVVRTLLAERAGLPRARAASSVLMDRAVGLLVQMAAGLLALLFAPRRVPAVLALTLGALSLAALTVMITLIGYRRVRLRWEAAPILGAILRKRTVARFIETFAAYDPRSVVTASMWTLVFAAILVATTSLVGSSLGVQAVALRDWAVVVPLASLAALLPSLAGWGAREWTYVGLLAALQPPVGADVAIAMGVVFGAFGALLGLLGAVLALLGRRPPVTPSSEGRESP